MPTPLKKFLITFLVFTFAFFTTGAAPILAQSPPPSPGASAGTWYNTDFPNWASKVYDASNPSEIFGERYTAAQVQWIIYGIQSYFLSRFLSPQLMSCLFSNVIDINTCLGGLTAAESIAPVASQSQPSPSLASLVFAKNRQFSGISYVSQKIENFKIIPTANAQTVGFGFGALEPVQKMWQTSRDMAFGLFVIVAIAFAFMIMFRVKISPQVVISVQTALPKVIGALILVTFSYAIAGFMVDLMYVVYGIFSVLGKGFVPVGTAEPATVFQFLTAGRLGGNNVGLEVGVLGLMALYLVLFSAAFAIVMFIVLGSIKAMLFTVVTVVLFTSTFGTILSLIGIVVLLVIFIVLIWNAIKILFSLLKAFTNILLLTIFAPIQIVAGALIPSLGFGAWLRSFASNLGVFVLTSILFFFSFVFLEAGVVIAFTSLGGSSGSPLVTMATLIANLLFGQATTSTFVNLFTSSSWPPLLSGQFGSASSGGITGLLMLGVSFVLFTLIPKATEVLQGLMSGRPFAYGTAIGEAFGPVAPFAEYGKSAAMRAAIRKGTTMDNQGRLPTGGAWDYLREGLWDAANQQRMDVHREKPKTLIDSPDEIKR